MIQSHLGALKNHFESHESVAEAIVKIRAFVRVFVVNEYYKMDCALRRLEDIDRETLSRDGYVLWTDNTNACGELNQ